MVGYIDAVTEIRYSKNKTVDYFIFDIVTEEKSVTVVCFDQQQRQDILNNSTTDNIFSFTDLQSKKNDLIMVSQTKYLKSDQKFAKELKLADIERAKTELPLYQRVHVVAIVYDLTELKPTRNNVRRMLGVIQDETSFMRIMVYGDSCSKISENDSKPCRFHYLRLTTDKGRTIISTTDETEIFEDLNGFDFPLKYVLMQKRDDVGIQKGTGAITCFFKNNDEPKPICPYCWKMDLCKENSYFVCKNEDCDITTLSIHRVQLMNYMNFELDLNDHNHQKSKIIKMKCSIYLLYKLAFNNDADLPAMDLKSAKPIIQKKLMDKIVHVSYHPDDKEVISLNLAESTTPSPPLFTYESKK